MRRSPPDVPFISVPWTLFLFVSRSLVYRIRYVVPSNDPSTVRGKRPVPHKRISAIFFKSEAGGEPVRDWLKGLRKEERTGMRGSKSFDHSGSSFDSFLDEEGVLPETEAIALKRVIAWQIQQAMAAKRLTKNAMAKRLCTSRSQIDRLLDPSHVGVSIETIARAAEAVGKRVTFQIFDAKSLRPKAAKNAPKLRRGKSAEPVRAQRKYVARAG